MSASSGRPLTPAWVAREICPHGVVCRAEDRTCGAGRLLNRIGRPAGIQAAIELLATACCQEAGVRRGGVEGAHRRRPGRA